MLIDYIAQVIGSASAPALDALHQAISNAWGAGHFSEVDAEMAYALIVARRDQLLERQQLGFFGGATTALPSARPPLPRTRFRTYRYQPARRHQDRIERRRQIASTGPLPPALTAAFTTSQLSVLAIVAEEAGSNGICALPLDRIAARAGVCRTTAFNAIRLAAQLGLLSRAERPQPGREHLTTILRVISREWRQWIEHGGRRAKRHRRDLFDRLEDIGVKKTPSTVRLRQRTNGQPLESPSNGPPGGLRPPPTAAFGGARLKFHQ